MAAPLRLRTRLAVLAVLVGAAALVPARTIAYVALGASWQTPVVLYYINTTNFDLLPAAIAPAVRAGADAWPLQSGASFRFEFAGLTPRSTVTDDGVNLVVFRNASSGSAIATTYWWSSGNRIVDADIVFWGGAFRFFAGSTGCANGFYIEDIAAHEFGHALGLGHSASSAATMYYATAPCNSGNRLLDADDIAGVRALYPPQQTPPLRAPTGVRIAS